MILFVLTSCVTVWLHRIYIAWQHFLLLILIVQPTILYMAVLLSDGAELSSGILILSNSTRFTDLI
jgi:hypothetical protein